MEDYGMTDEEIDEFITDDPEGYAESKAEVVTELEALGFAYNPETEELKMLGDVYTAGDEDYDFVVAFIKQAHPAVDEAIALIDAIGEVEYTAESKAKIDAARDAYDALTDAQKDLVSNYSTLTAAEDAYAALEAAAASSAEKAKDWVSVRIDDQICINFLLAQRDDFESVKVEYIDQELQTAAKTVVYADLSELTIREDHYLVPVVVAPAQIGDTIKATLTVGGQEIEYTMSVAEYCEYLIDNYNGDNAAAVIALAKATLEYGQAANDYFAGTGFYDASEITTITEAVDNTNIEDAKATRTLEITGDIGGKLTTAAFMALTKPEFRFYTTLTDEEAVELNKTISASGAQARFVKNAETGDILLEVKGVEAKDMNKVITIDLGSYGTIKFSGNDFARMMANSSDQAVKTLGVALYLYGVKAAECFG
jgi:hypothetical protein